MDVDRCRRGEVKLWMAPTFWGPVGFAIVVGMVVVYWILVLGAVLLGIVLVFIWTIVHRLSRGRMTARRRTRPSWKGGENPWRKGGPRSAAVLARNQVRWDSCPKRMSCR